ncbi:MAG: sodium:solute symporter [Planctomycetota bacterium]|nr:MAG: sodium:solute symporter [Planctomycetota bacterium]
MRRLRRSTAQGSIVGAIVGSSEPSPWVSALWAKDLLGARKLDMYLITLFRTMLLLAALLSGPRVMAQVSWQALPDLPDEIGFAGGFAGCSHGALVFAGGANFAKPYFDNAKRYHDRIFVLPSPKAQWIEVGKLRRALGYGASLSYGDELICIGGEDQQRAYAEVFALSWDGRALSQRELPSLPTPISSGGAARIGAMLYVIAGQTNRSIQSATSKVYRLDLADNKAQWQSLPDLPAPARAFHLVSAQHDGRSSKLYVVGGRHFQAGGPANLAFLKDCWAYDPQTQTWQRRADSPTPLMAGTAIAFGQSSIVVPAYADASALIAMLGSGIPAREYQHPGFPKPVYRYHTITDAWASLGNRPAEVANPVTTPAVWWNKQIVLVSGEVAPRVRTPKAWSMRIEARKRSFGAVNMAVLIVYLLGMVGVGIFFVFKNKSTNDYFRGGQQIPWWAAACSIYATMLSSLTYVALPALVFATDWVLYPGMFLILATAPIAIYVAMPFFRRIDATSAYEYLGKRFNLPTRLFASGLFTLFHIGRMGIVMALTALALAAVTPLSPAAAVLLMGLLCLVYCTLGGIEAVIWTDTIQTFVLLGGALLCLIFILMGVDGGLSGMIESGRAADKFTLFNFDFSSNSISTTAIWVIVLGGLGQNISSYTSDQAVVQRYMTTKDSKAAAKSIWANGVMAIPGALLFFLLGTGLYAFYRSHPESLDPALQNDQIFPQFIATELPLGLAGLIVAGIFAAAQSTVSTSMNSTATTLVTDFLRPFHLLKTEKAYLGAARLLTLLMGLLGTAAALIFVDPNIRSLFNEYFKVIGMFMGALGGLFILGVCTRKASGYGALLGILLGVAVMVTVWKQTQVNGYLYAAIGIASCVVFGYLASLVLPGSQRDLRGLTLHTVKLREPKETE